LPKHQLCGKGWLGPRAKELNKNTGHLISSYDIRYALLKNRSYDIRYALLKNRSYDIRY
jgi:hypothetical protein